VNARLFIEGGGPEGDLDSRCREGFRKLFEKAGFKGIMPRLIACRGRDEAFHDFETAIRHKKPNEFIALLVDSEDPMRDIEKAWEHLLIRDKWSKPEDAIDEQVLLMTTCMETWIASDRTTLRKHYGKNFNEKKLPPLHEIESRHRHEVQDALFNATAGCANSYNKGQRSYQVLGEILPSSLDALPSFQRVCRILKKNLK
jgi:hypothetical protein